MADNGVRRLTPEWRANIGAGVRKAHAEGRVKPRSRSSQRKNSEYYTSGEWKRHLQSIAQLGGFASGRARGLPKDLYAARQRMSCYIGTARRRGLCWELTEEEFRALVLGECWYCGAPPSNEWRVFKGVLFNGIDRINNSIGYTASNSVTACDKCNKAKRTMSQAEFLELVRRIAGRHGTNANS